MSEAVWKPNVTVAAIAERNSEFLLVSETVNGKTVYNQPAGHLEENETLIEAVIRETLEETQYEFTPTGLQGIYRSVSEEDSRVTYLRFLFTGTIGKHYNDALDPDIIGAHWMSYDAIKACEQEHRSPLVMQAIDDYRQHGPYSLDVISQLYA